MHDGTLILVNRHLPVPLVNIQRVDVVKLLVRTDCVHVGVDAEIRRKVHIRHLDALPFCKRMDNLHLPSAQVLHIERNRHFDSVQVVVQACIRRNEKRCRHPRQIQLGGKLSLKKLLDCGNGVFRFALAKNALVCFGNVQVTHNEPILLFDSDLLPKVLDSIIM